MAKLEVIESGQTGCIIVEGKGKFVPLAEWNKKAEQVMQLQREKSELSAQVETFKSVVQKLANIEHEHGGALQPCGQFAYRVKEYLFKEAKKALASISRGEDEKQNKN